MKEELELRFPQYNIHVEENEITFRNEIEFNIVNDTIYVTYMYKPFTIDQLNKFVDGIKGAKKDVEIQEYYNEHMEEIEAMEWDDNNYTVADKVGIYKNEL